MKNLFAPVLAARAEMARVAPLMEGRWKGAGRFRVSRDTTVETESEEIISLQLGVSALLIEGIHRDVRSKAMFKLFEVTLERTAQAPASR